MGNDFGSLMRSSFRDRLIRVHDFSQNPRISLDSQEFLMFLDESEKQCLKGRANRSVQVMQPLMQELE
jgi:hypothetical protein